MAEPGVWRSPIAVGLLCLTAFTACAIRIRSSLAAPLPASQMAEFWNEPVDLEQRDLLNGPGGAAQRPDSTDGFEFIKEDVSGASPGFDVRDKSGREWSVKLGVEAQSEVAVSRLVWATGFHQPATYYVPRWTLVQDGVSREQPGGRFRLTPANLKSSGTWAWHKNPFVGSDPFAGLVVLMAMVNNWDIKTSNNALFEFDAPAGSPARWFVVKDLGASLGRTGMTGGLFGPFRGTKNRLDDFERERFISGVSGDRVILHYEGAAYVPALPDVVRASHVRWMMERLARRSDEQWRQAFEAAGYSAADGQRYVRRLKAKVAEGLEKSGQ
jgi:hypothetical protein